MCASAPGVRENVSCFARIRKSKERPKFRTQLLAESTRLHFPGPNLRRSHALKFFRRHNLARLWVFLSSFVACSKIASELHAFIDSRSAACLIFIRRHSNRYREVLDGTKPHSQRSASAAFRSATAPAAARGTPATRASQQSRSPAGSPAQSASPTKLADANRLVHSGVVSQNSLLAINQFLDDGVAERSEVGAPGFSPGFSVLLT